MSLVNSKKGNSKAPNKGVGGLGGRTSLACLWILSNHLLIIIDQFVSGPISVPLAVLFTPLHFKNKASNLVVRR